jgi:signal transduction histidine kinase
MNIVAHDLKSPLHRISGLTSILELESALSGDQKDYVRLIKDSTRSGLDLITDLLDVNALEEVNAAPERKEVSVPRLLDEKIRSLKMAADNKQITLESHADVPNLIVTDEGYLNRIVDNLLSNAIKFSPQGSAVLIKAKVEGSNLVISVKDNGPGFMEEDMPFLFQKFKKLSARPTGGESSNGLGLAIVKTLIDRLKGDIKLNSGHGKGSEFIITLPL